MPSTESHASYPPAVQEYLAGFPQEEVPFIVDRLLLWAVRNFRVLTNQERTKHPVMLSPEVTLVSQKPEGEKLAGNVYGNYPTWWGHEEHRPTSQGEPQHQRRRVVSDPEGPWKSQKNVVGDATHKLEEAHTEQQNHATKKTGDSERLSRGETSDSEGFERRQASSSPSSPSRRKSVTKETAETSRRQLSRPTLNQPNMVYGGKPRSERRIPTYRAKSTSCPNKRPLSPGKNVQRKTEPSIAWEIQSPKSRSQKNEPDISDKGRNELQEVPREAMRATHNDVYSIRTSSPAYLYDMDNQSAETCPATIATSFLRSPFIQCLDKPEEDSNDCGSSIDY